MTFFCLTSEQFRGQRVNVFLAWALLNLLRSTGSSETVPLVIFQAFGNGIAGFEIPWPFAAIFLPTDSESFALAMETNKTKMSKRRGKKLRFGGGEKGLGEEYF